MLAEGATGVLERLASLDAVVADLREGRVGTLSVGYFPSAGAAWIPPVVTALSREFPEIRMDLRLCDVPDEQRSPADIELFIEGADGERDVGYHVHRLLEEPYLVVVPATHRLAGHRSVALRELAHESWSDHDFTSGPCRRAVIDACTSVGFTPAFRVETHDHPTALSFVAAGMGVTVLPRLCLRPVVPPGLVAVPVVEPVPLRRIAVRVRHALRHHPAARRFVALMQEQVD